MDINSQEVREWRKTMVPYIAAEAKARGIKQEDMTPEIMRELVLSAHNKLNALIEEMVEGRSRRSQIAKEALALDIYLTATKREELARMDSKYSN